MSEKIEAAIVGFFMLLLCFLNVPVADHLEKDQWTPEFRAQFKESVDPITSFIVLNAVDFNYWYDPAQQLFDFPMAVLQIPQTWRIYNHASHSYRMFEVRVDGEVKYRTPGNEYRWQRTKFRHFRIAYQLNDFTRPGARQNSWASYSRFVLELAWQDFPDAEEIDLIWYEGEYPGVQMFESYRVISPRRGAMEYLPVPPTIAARAPEDL